jgi:hypothetical protein
MLGQAGGPSKPRPAALYWWVDDVDATYERAPKAGASSESEPEGKPYGHRNAGVIDTNEITCGSALQSSRGSVSPSQRTTHRNVDGRAVSRIWEANRHAEVRGEVRRENACHR